MRLAAVLVAFSLTPPASAEDGATFVVGAGATGIWRHNSHVTDTVAIGSLEYRANYDLGHEIKPLVGVFGATDDSSYVHAGVYRDFTLSSRWTVTPHFSVGGWSEGTKNDLGGKLEFQSGVDFLYPLPHRWRMGVTLRHVSNAGIYHINPGIETIEVLLSAPLN